MNTKQKELTPMMKQWTSCKETSGSALLLFRLGDFYECFYEDAEILSSSLMITLTKRQSIPMAGIPVQSLQTNLEKLINLGLSVALAEQLERKDEKSIVERKVTSIITPSTYTCEKNFNSGSNNFLLSISLVNKSYAISYIDTSTSEFFTANFSNKEALLSEVFKIAPKEIVVCKKHLKKSPDFFNTIKDTLQTKIISIDPLFFNHESCLERLHSHFQVRSLDCFGLGGDVAAINGCGALLLYLENEIFFDVSVIKNLVKRDNCNYLFLGHMALSHLEVFYSHSGISLLNVINNTKTPMGERLLKNSLLYPLINKEEIEKRQNFIEELTSNDINLSSSLKGVKDLERLMTKIASKKATPSDLIFLAKSILQFPEITKNLQEALKDLTQNSPSIDFCTKILETIDLNQNEYMIKMGVNKELDRLKEMEKNSKKLLQDYEEKCKRDFGIKTLKIGHSRSYGYFLEVSKKSTHLVPATFSRRQTLVNAERYITNDLSEIEQEILQAKESAFAIENEIFGEIVNLCISHQGDILKISSMIANIDFFESLHIYAKQNDCIKPSIHEGFNLEIKNGAHPILLHKMKNQLFIPNDIDLNEEKSLAILTGPNMAGKSTYIKSCALLTILAQIGSFIPAQSANLAIVDKVFTRIGANDDIQKGQSTFMMEMSETANILKNATRKSLIILDEIGRGTATFDGIALAKSIATYIATNICAKTLFATHYLELTELQDQYSAMNNIRSTVNEENGNITFLHKIEDGKADKSYGVFVGSLAGLPRKVLLDAKHHLDNLSLQEKPVKKKEVSTKTQFSLFTEEKEDHFVVDEIKKMNLDHISPFEALQTLISWKNKIN